MNADRNLLFGILAFQNNFIDRQALLAAFDRWTTDKNKALGDILVEMGQLDVRYRELLDGLVAAHLEQHGNDPEKSLAAISPVYSVRDDLKQLADPDVEASLAHVSMAPVKQSLDTTITWTAGSPTSAGARFRVLRSHAKGGLGEVFVAHDEELDREVAFKEIQDRHADKPESRGRFVLEAKVTGGLEHPGIVPVYGMGSYADGRPFYAMRFVKGDSLKDAIKRFHQAKTTGRDHTERMAELRKLLGRFIDVCNAIEYAHSRGVLHRDLKPGNIMLGSYGETLVVDWGLAKIIGRPESNSNGDEATLRPAVASGSSATQMGEVIGTPQYMSPEQAAGRWEDLGPASDVYSLGATLYSLLTGQAPINEGATLNILARAVKGDFPAPRSVEKAVPRALEAICLKAMALNPTERYTSPRALADDIERWLNDQPVSAHRDPVSRRFARWVRNHKGTAGAAVATVAVLLVGSIVASAIGRRANEQTRALAATDTLLNVSAAAVPLALDNLQPVGRLALGRLRDEFDDPQSDPVQRLHAAFALAKLDEAPQEFLLDAVVTAPAGECGNLVAALIHVKKAALPELARRAGFSLDTAEKARYAIVALHLGDPKPAMDALAVRSDPIHRTTLIHTYASWHGDLSVAAELLGTNEDSAFRSGLCAALGTIEPATLAPAERDRGTKALLAIYSKTPDGGTHAAADWALRQWKRELPLIAPSSHPPSDRRWFVNGQGMAMVEVPAGKFTMGALDKTQFDQTHEKPAHEVTLTNAFYLAEREVTVKQFKRFIDDAEYPAPEKPQGWEDDFQPSKRMSPAPDCPVHCINWFDAVLFCNWLSAGDGRRPCYDRTGQTQTGNVIGVRKEVEYDVWHCDFAADGYRLPTEAEWEYASRAGSSSRFCFGSDDDLLPQYAWFAANAKFQTWPGGAKLPSAFGLFDMHGNVLEWCWDLHGRYAAEAIRDPTGAIVGFDHVVRGGGVLDIPGACRAAYRSNWEPVTRRNAIGFRVLCGR